MSRNGGLDAMRFAAAALVFIAHAGLAVGTITFAGWGLTGVAIFFALSGYLIPLTWQSAPDRRYAARRFLRIMPAYWFAVIVLGYLTGVQITPATLLMLQPIDVTSFNVFLGVAWTLRVEIVFYALVPLIALVPTRWLLVAAAASLVAALTVTDPAIQALAPFRLWMFLPGILVARATPARLPASLALLGAVLIAGDMLLGNPAVELLAVAGAGLLLAVAVGRPVTVPRWVVAGSTISYGIFLWHHELLRALRDAGWGSMGIILGGIALTLIAATASWWLVERPAIMLGRTWPAKPVRSVEVAA